MTFGRLAGIEIAQNLGKSQGSADGGELERKDSPVEAEMDMRKPILEGEKHAAGTAA